MLCGVWCRPFSPARVKPWVPSPSNRGAQRLNTIAWDLEDHDVSTGAPLLGRERRVRSSHRMFLRRSWHLTHQCELYACRDVMGELIFSLISGGRSCLPQHPLIHPPFFLLPVPNQNRICLTEYPRSVSHDPPASISRVLARIINVIVYFLKTPLFRSRKHKQYFIYF